MKLIRTKMQETYRSGRLTFETTTVEKADTSILCLKSRDTNDILTVHSDNNEEQN